MGKVCTFLTSSNAANMASPVDHTLSSKVIKSFWIFFKILFLDLVSQPLKNNLCNWWTHSFFYIQVFTRFENLYYLLGLATNDICFKKLTEF